MRILHVIPSYIQAYRYGGAVKAAHELCRTLVKKGLEVLVITTDVDWEKRLDIPLGRPVDIEGVKVIYYPSGLLKSFYYSGGLARAVKEHIPNFDITHIHSVYLYPTMVAAYWCRRYKRPYLINPFGALDPSMIALKSKLKKSLYIKFIEAGNINNASVVHVASDYEKDRYMSLGFRAPAVVVPRGIDLQDYADRGQLHGLRTRYPQLKDKKVVLFLSRIHVKKGLDILASAFKKVYEKDKDVYLVIAGPSEKGYGENVKRLFEAARTGDRVLYTGTLLGDDKLAALYGSDIFVLPSYGENFGISILEAMTCGLPIVTTDCVGLYPDIAEYKSGIVAGCEPDAIADAMSVLLDNGDLRRQMGENGKRLVRDRFTWDTVADRMIRVYEDILKKGQGSGR